MKNRTFLMISVLTFLTLLSSCKKEGLTKATQKGANTFSCKINGKVFTPCRDNGLFGSASLIGGVSISAIAIARVTAKCTNDFPKKDISIELDNFRGVGVYALSNSDNSGVYTEYIPVLPYTKTFEQSNTTPGKVIITKDDRSNYILSGTFEFTAANTDSINNIITVTDGRFDISYK